MNPIVSDLFVTGQVNSLNGDETGFRSIDSRRSPPVSSDTACASHLSSWSTWTLPSGGADKRTKQERKTVIQILFKGWLFSCETNKHNRKIVFIQGKKGTTLQRIYD